MRAHSCLLLPRPPRSLPLPPPVPYPPLPSSSSSPLTSANSLCTGSRPRLAFALAVPFRAQACFLMQPSARSCSAGRLNQQAHWSGLLRRGCWSVMRSRGPPMMSPRFVPTAWRPQTCHSIHKRLIHLTNVSFTSQTMVDNKLSVANSSSCFSSCLWDSYGIPRQTNNTICPPLSVCPVFRRHCCLLLFLFDYRHISGIL